MRNLIFPLLFLIIACSSTEQGSCLDKVNKPPQFNEVKLQKKSTSSLDSEVAEVTSQTAVKPYDPRWRLKKGEKLSKKKVVIRFQEKKTDAWTQEEKAVKNMSKSNLLDRPFLEDWPKPRKRFQYPRNEKLKKRIEELEKLEKNNEKKIKKIIEKLEELLKKQKAI